MKPTLPFPSGRSAGPRPAATPIRHSTRGHLTHPLAKRFRAFIPQFRTPHSALRTYHNSFVKILIPILLLSLTACRRDMFNQPRANPLASSDFFPDGAASRPLIPGTIPRGHLDADEAFFTGKIGTNLVNNFPIPVTLALLERGQERYNIYCAVCHGPNGDGHGVVVQRGFPAPPSYHIDRLRQMPPGYFFNVITHGYGVMYSYAARVEPADRWAIAAYIRALQLSHDARFTDVPASEQAALEKERR